MKKTTTILSFALATTFISAQTTADFENLTLVPNTYYNGSNGTPSVTSQNTFTSGNCIFANKWNGSGYWESGWAYSNMKDSITAGYTNQYSARTAVGYTNSSNYVIAQGDSKLKFNALAQGKQMEGFYVTNSTYAAISMRDGDMFGKKFGGTSGNDPDWFKLKIQKYLGGALWPDSVTFYLADFRFTNNAQDYVVKSWQYIDLTSLGNADSLVFSLSSSDNSGGYMNTPSYFCVDNFTTKNSIVGISELESNESSLVLFPNPTHSQVSIQLKNKITNIDVFNKLGELVMQSKESVNDISALPNGIYFVRITDDKMNLITKRLIKN